MNSEQIEKLKQIQAKGSIDPGDEQFIWELHLEKTGMYPTGNITCANCRREAFQTLWNIMQAHTTCLILWSALFITLNLWAACIVCVVATFFANNLSKTKL